MEFFEKGRFLQNRKALLMQSFFFRSIEGVDMGRQYRLGYALCQSAPQHFQRHLYGGGAIVYNGKNVAVNVHHPGHLFLTFHMYGRTQFAHPLLQKLTLSFHYITRDHKAGSGLYFGPGRLGIANATTDDDW